MLAELSQWRSCRLRGSLASEGATLWRFRIFKFGCDEAEALPRFLDSSTGYVAVMSAIWPSVIVI